MKYQGSKNRIAKQILPVIISERSNGQYYVEPFVGGCNSIDKVGGKRIGNDNNKYLIAMWKAFQSGWLPQSEVTEELYIKIKNNKEDYPSELVGFVGIACSFGSKWFGGYARNKRGQNYAMEGRGNLIKQINKIKGVEFYAGDYDGFNIPEKSIIYCDPPYAETSGYSKKFNTSLFWEWARLRVREKHTLFISEYVAPGDFLPVWEQKINTNMEAEKFKQATERLFMHESQIPERKMLKLF